LKYAAINCRFSGPVASHATSVAMATILSPTHREVILMSTPEYEVDRTTRD